MLYRNSSNLPIPIIKFNKPVKAVRFFHSFSTEKNIASKPADRRLLATAQQIDNLLRNAEDELQHKTTISTLVIEMSENASILESRQLSWRWSKRGSFQPSHIWNNIDFGRQFKGVISPRHLFPPANSLLFITRIWTAALRMGEKCDKIPRVKAGRTRWFSVGSGNYLMPKGYDALIRTKPKRKRSSVFRLKDFFTALT